MLSHILEILGFRVRGLSVRGLRCKGGGEDTWHVESYLGDPVGWTDSAMLFGVLCITNFYRVSVIRD